MPTIDETDSVLAPLISEWTIAARHDFKGRARSRKVCPALWLPANRWNLIRGMVDDRQGGGWCARHAAKAGDHDIVITTVGRGDARERQRRSCTAGNMAAIRQIGSVSTPLITQRAGPLCRHAEGRSCAGMVRPTLRRKNDRRTLIGLGEAVNMDVEWGERVRKLAV